MATLFGGPISVQISPLDISFFLTLVLILQGVFSHQSLFQVHHYLDHVLQIVIWLSEASSFFQFYLRSTWLQPRCFYIGMKMTGRQDCSDSTVTNHNITFVLRLSH